MQGWDGLVIEQWRVGAIAKAYGTMSSIVTQNEKPAAWFGASRQIIATLTINIPKVNNKLLFLFMTSLLLFVLKEMLTLGENPHEYAKSLDLFTPFLNPPCFEEN